MSGSEPSAFRNVVMAFLGIEHGLVHVHVEHLRAAFDLLARDGQRRLVFCAADQFGEISASR